MPWTIEKRGEEWCVVKESDGSSVGCHGSEKDAKDQLAALYASEKMYIAPRPFRRVDKAFGPRQIIDVWKADDGLRYMFLITSNSYEDREEETITTRGLKRDVERTWVTNDKFLSDNPLLFWHDGDPIGDIVWADMEGPFLIEVARERKNRRIRLSVNHEATVKEVWDCIEKNPHRFKWGASHMFAHPSEEKTERTYQTIRKLETSVLPLQSAANPYTFSGVIPMNERDKVLDQMLGRLGAAEKLRKIPQNIKQILDKAGVQHKQMEDMPPPPAPEEQAAPDPMTAIIDTIWAIVLGEGDDATKRAQLAEVIGELMGGGSEPAAEGMAMMEDKAFKALTPLLDQLVESQVTLSDEQQKMAKALGMLANLSGLQTEFKGLKDGITALRAKVAAVESFLTASPRIASKDNGTVIKEEDNGKQKEHADKGKRDSFWGG